jgi:hypothetical protein
VRDLNRYSLASCATISGVLASTRAAWRAPASVDWTTGAMRAASTRVSSKRSRWKDQSRYLCSAAFITFISKPNHDVLELILAPYNRISCNALV